MRIKCIVSYDGTDFYGYQRQNAVRTVQEEIEKAIYKVYYEEVIIHGSGRTDRGVHAIGQVFHFDVTNKSLKEEHIVDALNTYLPKDVRILSASVVDENFHSRFSVREKEYHYKIMKKYSLFDRNFSTYVRNISVGKLIEIKEIFIGKHDFFSYCKYQKDKDTIKEIYNIDVIEDENFITIVFKGEGFLRYQVRYLVGAMMMYSTDKISKDLLVNMLNERYTQKRIKVAEPCGLYLYNVKY